MQSYKLRKTSEIVLFPIEHELKLLRQESDRSWTTLTAKILSVIFSGIGTTVLFQQNGLPELINSILNNKLPMFLIIVIQVVAAICIFILFSVIFVKIINGKNESKDNKKGNFERENLAEIFHKIILNNIITGKSFTKKAQVKYIEMLKYISKKNAENEIEPEEAVTDIKSECCLYISEALYYFLIAKKQIGEERIIEIGKRNNYIIFLNEVGILTLTESILMYEKSVKELREILNKLLSMSLQWNESEIKSLKNSINKIDEIIENIMEWKNNLSNTIGSI